ncbi:MAG: hypothetical protein GY950_10015 [bacterium]|nr:hypothetical protein [bacterium]
MEQRQQCSEPFVVEVENGFIHAKRDILVYSSYKDEHEIIRSPFDEENNGNDGVDIKGISAIFEIPEAQAPQDEEHYLLITLAPGHTVQEPDEKKERQSKVQLPSIANLDIELNEDKKGKRGSFKIHPSKGRPRILIEKGFHNWQLKVTAPSPEESAVQAAPRIEDYNVTVGADEPSRGTSGPDDTVRVGDNG